MARDREHPAPTTATQRRPGQASHASASARPSRAARPPKGSRTSPPGGGGEGNADPPNPELVRPQRELQPLSATPLSHPCQPQGRAPLGLGDPAVASATAIPLRSPVDAIFSPSSSFSQRPSPSRVPPRRRTAQARNPQPRTLPSGQASGVAEEERTGALRLFAPEAVDPILSQRAERDARSKRGASGASAPVSEGHPRTRELLGARRGGSEWLRPPALGTVSKESALEGDGSWREDWGKGSRPAWNNC